MAAQKAWANLRLSFEPHALSYPFKGLLLFLLILSGLNFGVMSGMWTGSLWLLHICASSHCALAGGLLYLPKSPGCSSCFDIGRGQSCLLTQLFRVCVATHEWVVNSPVVS